MKANHRVAVVYGVAACLLAAVILWRVFFVEPVTPELSPSKSAEHLAEAPAVPDLDMQLDRVVSSDTEVPHVADLAEASDVGEDGDIVDPWAKLRLSRDPLVRT